MAGLIFVKMSGNNTLHTLELWTGSEAEAGALPPVAAAHTPTTV